MNNEIKRIIIDEGHFTEPNYPFTIQTNFSTLGSLLENSEQGPIISFFPNDSIQNLLRFNGSTMYEEYNFLPNTVGTLSFDNIFLECDVAQGRFFKEKRSGIILN